MVWGLALIAVGLVGWLIYMWLGYLRQISVLRLKHEQLRQRLELHLQTSAEARERTAAVSEQLAETEKAVMALREKLVLFKGSKNKAGDEWQYSTRHKVE